MTQVYFQDGSPSAGTAFDFLAEANSALISYITSVNVNANIDNLRDYLVSINLTIRDRKERNPMLAESPSNYPICYVDSVAERAPKVNKGAIHVHGKSTLTIWDSQPNPSDAVARCVAASGAIASMLKQTVFDSSATDWSQWYSNTYLDPTVNAITAEAPVIETNDQGEVTGRAKVVLSVAWYHFETLT